MAALRKGWYCKDITIIIYQPIVILFLISNGNIYTHKKFQIVVTAKIYTLEIPFCGCINQCVQNLVPARICTFESTLRADHSLQLSPCYFFFFFTIYAIIISILLPVVKFTFWVFHIFLLFPSIYPIIF